MFVGCKQQAPTPHLGKIEFHPTGAEAAQPAFQRGLLLLHSFEYDDAAEAFREARQIDPDFAMAYWGEAMCSHHPLWRYQDQEKAKEILAQLGDTPEARQAKAGTELERDLLQAAEVLFGEGTKPERDQAYADLLGRLYEKYPGNNEVAAFYALSLLGSVPVGRDEQVYGKGAQIAQGILASNPRHPGALHYLIHSYDDPGHAAQALEAANSYSKVAPDAAHALHMPSHIYVALGMWNEVVNSNIASYQASVSRMERMNLDNDARSYHALHWLLYGHLQKGQFDEAAVILREMIQYTDELPSKSARAYLRSMQGNFLVETGDWTGEFVRIPIDEDDLNISVRAIGQYVAGKWAFENGEPDSLQQIIEQMEEARHEAERVVGESGVPMCNSSGWTSNVPNRLDIDQAQVMELELRGLHAWFTGDPAAAEQRLREATELEASISYSYGPPPVVQPSFELYGQWLLANERYEEALAQFDTALARGPRRVAALQGKLRAAEALGRTKAIESLQSELADIREQTGI